MGKPGSLAAGWYDFHQDEGVGQAYQLNYHIHNDEMSGDSFITTEAFISLNTAIN